MKRKSIRIARIPTPLQRLDRISEAWGGEIWIKRDDLTGSGLSGNKARKLEYLLADAHEHGADTIITCGAIQSNHCRATALAARQQGFECHLILRGERPEAIDGNLLLDKLAAADIHYVPDQLYRSNLDQEFVKIANSVKSQGGKPYLIPEGGSNAIGAYAYVEALREFKAQCQEQNVHPQRVICATGSGGTHAGLLAGVQMESWSVEVISMAVCYSSAETNRRIGVILEELERETPSEFKPDFNQIKSIDSYLGAGYALAGEDVFSVISEMGRLEGILVDPVYTGKTATGIKHEVQAGRMPGTTVFWHTGGMFGLFPFRDALGRFLG